MRPLAITMGEPAGIGGEIALKAWLAHQRERLPPFFAIDFAHGINVTLGLLLVRTSPDHGTALDLAGTGRASAAGLIASIKLAGAIAGCRAHAARQRQTA